MIADDQSQAYVRFLIEGPQETGLAPGDTIEERYYLCESQKKLCTEIDGALFSADTISAAIDVQNKGMPFIFDGWNRKKKRFVVSWDYERSPDNNLDFCVYHMDTKKYECPEFLPNVHPDPLFNPTISPSGNKAIVFDVIDNKKTSALIYDIDNVKKFPQQITFNGSYQGNGMVFWFDQEQSILIVDKDKKIARLDLLNNIAKEIEFPSGLEPLQLSPSGRHLVVMSVYAGENLRRTKVLDLSNGKTQDIGFVDTDDYGDVQRFHGALQCYP